MRFLKDYDMFDVSDTMYLLSEEEIYVICSDGEELVTFKEGAEIVVHSISKESGYGNAIVSINGYVTKLGLDELYSMTFD